MERRQNPSLEQKEMIDYSQYYEKIDYPYSVQLACIDGRRGRISGLFPKLPGACLHLAISEWVLSFEPNEKETIQEQFKNTFQNYSQYITLGVHCDSHHENDKIESGCGFADKIKEILTTYVDRKEEIWQRLTNVVPSLKDRENVWMEIMENLQNKTNKFNELPARRELIGSAEEKGAQEMTLVDEHNEEAAIVNYKENYVINSDRAVDEKHSAFNLDMWYLKNVLRMAGKSDEYINKAELFALGAFVATEMVLVESKGKPALPIIINQ